MKVYVNRRKNRMLINAGVVVKSQISSCKDDYAWNLSTCDCECNKACKIDEYLDNKNCLCEKRLIGKLVLECEYQYEYVRDN